MDQTILFKIKVIRVVAWVMFAGVAGWVVFEGLVPFGSITYRYQPDKKNHNISQPTPDTRVQVSSQKSLFVFGDPIYFSLYAPRAFDRLRINIMFKRIGNRSKSPIIEAGILADKTAWRYDLEPIDNIYLDDMLEEWETEKKDGLLFMQKNRKYGSVEEFLAGEKDIFNNTAVYNYSLEQEYILAGYEPESIKKSIQTDIRGEYQFYTYIKDENLDFQFHFSDLNRNLDDDPVEIFLVKNNRVIVSRQMAGDSDSTDQGNVRDIGKAELQVHDLPDGLYKIEVKAGGDIITKTIETAQSKISFISKVRLYANSGKSIFTDCTKLWISSDNPSAIGPISAGSSSLDMAGTYKRFDFKLPKTPMRLDLKVADMELAGPGFFAFNESGLLNPDIIKVDANFSDVKDEIKFVIADYQPPQNQGEWFLGRADIDLRSAYRENFRYNLILSIPGLMADDQGKDGIEIKEMSAVFAGQMHWRIFAKEIMQNFKALITED